MRVAAVGLVLAVAACATPRGEQPPQIAPTPTQLVFTGAESCESLRAMHSRAYNDERIMLSSINANWHSRDTRSLFSLGMSDLELNSQIRKVASSRGDMIALRAELERRGCVRGPIGEPVSVD